MGLLWRIQRVEEQLVGAVRSMWGTCWVIFGVMLQVGKFIRGMLVAGLLIGLYEITFLLCIVKDCTFEQKCTPLPFTVFENLCI